MSQKVYGNELISVWVVLVDAPRCHSPEVLSWKEIETSTKINLILLTTYKDGSFIDFQDEIYVMFCMNQMGEEHENCSQCMPVRRKL